MSGFQPLDSNKSVTNKDLAQAYNQLHQCLHDVGKRVDVVSDVVHGMELSVSNIQGALGVKPTSQAAMSAGEPPQKVSRKLAGLSLWQAIFGLMSSLAGAAVLYKILEPAVIAGAVALRQALMAL